MMSSSRSPASPSTTIPDAVVRGAEQIELVDMTAEALRRRMAHGNIYKSDKVDAALANYFRVGNLTALRELALLWLADKVDEQLDRYRRDHGIEGTCTLVLKGRTLDASDQRVVEAFAVQAALALRQQRLSEQAAAAIPVAEADKLRTALLRAVSHDLRAPLASAKAAVRGLQTPDVVFEESDRQELLATADESLDLLARLVENLLDMSRLQAGALGVNSQPTSIAEVIPLAIDELGPTAGEVEIHLAEDLPEVIADPALVQRILANLLSNAAFKYSPLGSPAVVAASAHGDRVHVRVIDHGPGLSPDERDRAFLPFQRSGDRHGPPGIGLGLALSKGLAEAMGGTLEADDTPGEGLTMDLSLPRCPRRPAAEGAEEVFR